MRDIDKINNDFAALFEQGRDMLRAYRNNGAQLVNYTIEATVAQNYVRR